MNEYKIPIFQIIILSIIILGIILLSIPNTKALVIDTNYDSYNINTSKNYNIKFYFLIDDNYKTQKIDFYINGSNTTFINTVYMNFSKSFFIDNKKAYFININFLDYKSEYQVIKWGINTINNSINKELYLNSIGINQDFNLTDIFTSVKDRNKRYGFYQNITIFKNNCLEANKNRKYPIKC